MMVWELGSRAKMDEMILQRQLEESRILETQKDLRAEYSALVSNY